ncbi:MAG: hypothetical protein EPN22_12855 [Nitrospirae bacterium]|nr:MAG: hypothetical protein EPN22_12855 [Nitrospirota bacterium]
MKNKQILFVTSHAEGFDEGVSYALDLAKTLNSNISVLMLNKKKLTEKFEDVMSIVAFAEEGDFKTAQELIESDLNDKYEIRINALKKMCAEAGVKMDVSSAATDLYSAIKNLLGQNDSIEMILLSPGITGAAAVTSKELNRLVKTASRPVVTMARNAFAA